MALVFVDGFDSYGVASDVVAGKWSTGSFIENWSLTEGRFGGQGIRVGNLTRVIVPTKQILIGGAINMSTYGGSYLFLIYDTSGSTSNIHCSLACDSFGRLNMYHGDSSLIGDSVLIGQTSHFLPLLTWHYIELMVKIGDGTAGNTGTFEVRVNDQPILWNFNANTKGGTGYFIGAVGISGGIFATDSTWDDVYICDTSGPINNGFLGDIRVETLNPDSDVSTELNNFNMMGNSIQRVQAWHGGIGPNTLYVERYLCDTSGIVNKGYILFGFVSQLAAKVKMVIYSDAGGLTGNLIGTSDEVVGIVYGVGLGAPFGDSMEFLFTVPVNLTGGDFYWIGFISDTVLYLGNINVTGVSATHTVPYSSGPPTSAPVMSIGTLTSGMSVTIDGGDNYSAVNEPEEDGDNSYVYSNVNGALDFYSYDNLSPDVDQVFGVQVSPMLRKTNTGLRTGSAVIRTPGMGNLLSPEIYPGINYVYYPEMYNRQSDGVSLWTPDAVNDINAGIKVGAGGIGSIVGQVTLGVSLGTYWGDTETMSEGNTTDHYTNFIAAMGRVPLAIASVGTNPADTGFGAPNQWPGTDISDWPDGITKTGNAPVLTWVWGDGTINNAFDMIANGATTVVSGHPVDYWIQRTLDEWRDAGFTTLFIRPNWEFNQGFVGMGLDTVDDQPTFIAAWKHFANVCHQYALDNSMNIKLVWCPSISGLSDAESLGIACHSFFPVPDGGAVGGQYVDVIGPDVYAFGGDPAVLIDTPATDGNLLTNTQWCFKSMVDIAVAYGCTMAICELGDFSLNAGLPDQSAWTDWIPNHFVPYMQSLQSMTPPMKIEFISLFDLTTSGAVQFSDGSPTNSDLEAWRNCLGLGGTHPNPITTVF